MRAFEAATDSFHFVSTKEPNFELLNEIFSELFRLLGPS